MKPLILAAIAIGIACGFGIRSCAVHGIGLGYSEGDRAGVVVKISHKGWIWKSWEGQMNLGGMAMKQTDAGSVAVPNVWSFSITDQSVVEALQRACETGNRVTVHYRQYLAGPVTIDSDYLAESVTEPKP